MEESRSMPANVPAKTPGPGEARKLARELHDLRFEIQDMAGGKQDSMGAWLQDVARRVEDLEFRAVVLAEAGEGGSGED